MVTKLPLMLPKNICSHSLICFKSQRHCETHFREHAW